jgi:hypothetical protein
LGVYDGDKFLGWVTLTDLSREFSKENLLDRLRSHNVPEVSEVRCPNCNKAFMEKVPNSEGVIVVAVPELQVCTLATMLQTLGSNLY